MACPIETSFEFKKLSNQVGRELAIYTWHSYNEAYPQIHTNTELRKLIGIPYTGYNDNIWRAAQRVRRYNAKNGTAHYFVKERVGQSEQYKLLFKPNYLPVNIEKQRQRDLIRDKRNEAWLKFYDMDFNEVSESVIKEKAKIESGIIEEEINEDVFGINESIPELEVHILGENQYEHAGEVYATYEDALAAANSDPFDLQEIQNKADLESLRDKIDLELQVDLENMYPTPKLLDYLHSVGSKRLSIEQFYKEASSLMINMKSSYASNEEILDAIKCI